ncbi:MAG: ABC1 kinase family protein [Crocosphaera sp.]
MVIIRFVFVVTVIAFEIFYSLAFLCFSSFGKNRQSISLLLAKRLPIICQRLGGAFPKVAQILATRADLLPLDICQALSCLQDRVKPLSPKITQQILDKNICCQNIQNIDTIPVASATVAQVHRAICRDNGQEIALKVLRPGVKTSLKNDCQILQFFGRLIAQLPFMQSIPVQEALKEVSDILIGQTDFVQEASNLKRLHTLFGNNNDIIVPLVHEDLCTPEILVMEFIPELDKLSNPLLPENTARKALTVGLQALYQMIFKEGFIHCDMHPGNVLVAQNGQLVILDAGFMVQLDELTRCNFAKFFLSIAFRNGKSAARIVRETAQFLPENLDVNAFDHDITRLIEQVGGLQAGDFQVVGFVGELFAIQRKHGLYSTNQFTLTILALLVFEGLAKQQFPDLNFQKEAVPFVMAALN